MGKSAYLRHLQVFPVKDPRKMALRESKAKRAKEELVRLIQNEKWLEHGTREKVPNSDLFGSYWWVAVREAVLHRDGYKCTMCGSTENLQVHHICPRHCGGSDNPLNLRTLCVECHRKVHQNDR